VPVAPPADPFINTDCLNQVRPPELDADNEVVAAGWLLFSSYEGGWGVIIVKGTVGFDGMCRPMGYQSFVFVDGVFAGTISPEPMASRATGAGSVAAITAGDRVSATFVRYAADDPLCCPSLQSVFVSYRIDRTPLGPVLVPDRAF